MNIRKCLFSFSRNFVRRLSLSSLALARCMRFVSRLPSCKLGFLPFFLAIAFWTLLNRSLTIFKVNLWNVVVRCSCLNFFKKHSRVGGRKALPDGR